MYVTAKVACGYYNCSETTLRSWANEGRIEFNKTEGGHRRYKIPDKAEGKDRLQCIYARVSSRKQEADLERQVTRLEAAYPGYSVFRDIGSGINFHRKEFQALVERVVRGEVREVVVADRDRLSRFGFEFLEWLFRLYDTSITIVSDEQRDPEREFVDGLLSSITVYTSRYYGKRGHQKGKEKGNENGEKEGKEGKEGKEEAVSDEDVED